jgi:hypothetical protein
MTLMTTPNPLTLLAQQPNKRQFSSKSTTSKTRPNARFTPTRRENFQRNQNHGHQYIMVLIEMDSNAILVAAMKNRLAGKMICAYQELVDHL